MRPELCAAEINFTIYNYVRIQIKAAPSWLFTLQGKLKNRYKKQSASIENVSLFFAACCYGYYVVICCTQSGTSLAFISTIGKISAKQLMVYIGTTVVAVLCFIIFAFLLLYFLK